MNIWYEYIETNVIVWFLTFLMQFLQVECENRDGHQRQEELLMERKFAHHTCTYEVIFLPTPCNTIYRRLILAVLILLMLQTSKYDCHWHLCHLTALPTVYILTYLSTRSIVHAICLKICECLSSCPVVQTSLSFFGINYSGYLHHHSWILVVIRYLLNSALGECGSAEQVPVKFETSKNGLPVNRLGLKVKALTGYLHHHSWILVVMRFYWILHWENVRVLSRFLLGLKSQKMDCQSRD